MAGCGGLSAGSVGAPDASGPSAEAVDPSEPVVPAAVMTVAGMRYPGELGSYSLPTGGSDGPWLPAAALGKTVVASVHDVLVVSILGAEGTTWRAVYAAADEPETASPVVLATSGGPAGADGPAGIEVPAPPAGDWVVMVDVHFATGGSGAYYWHVAVTK